MAASVLGPLDVVLLAAYFVLLGGISFIVSRHQSRLNSGKSASATETYFLAERSVSWWAVAASLFASNIGSEHFVGLAGSAAASGIAVGFYEVGAIPVVIMTGQFFLPTYFTSKIQTTPEYVEKRYNLFCRTTIVVVSLVLYIFSKTSATLFAGELILVELLNVNKTVAVILLMGFTVVYTVLGGLEAVIYTETLQTVVLLIGGLIVVGFTFIEVGGWNGLTTGLEELPEVRDDFLHFFRDSSDASYPWTGFVFGFFIIAPWYWGIDQVIVQRALAAKNIAHGQLGCTAAALLKFLPFIMMVLPGMCARVLVTRALETPEELAGFNFDTSYPWLVHNVVPKNARGIIIASMLSSLMSALASVFNSSATLFALNVWKLHFPGSTENELVSVGRVAVVVLAIISLCWLPIMPYLGSSLFLITQKPPAYMAPPILTLFLWGMLSKRPTRTAGQWTLSTGVAVGALRFMLEVIEDLMEKKMFGIFTSINFLHFAAISFWSCTCMLFLFSCFLKDNNAYRFMESGEELRNEDLKSLLFRWSAFYELMGHESANSNLKPIDTAENRQISEVELSSLDRVDSENNVDFSELSLMDVELHQSFDQDQIEDNDTNNDLRSISLERENSDTEVLNLEHTHTFIGRKLILTCIAIILTIWLVQIIRFR